MTKTKMVKGVEMVCLTVSDAKKTKHLFCDILGLDLAEEAPQYNWMEFKAENGAYIGAGEPCHEGMKTGTNARISFSVDNVEEAKAHLEAHGVEVGDIQEVPEEVKIAEFKDYDGNEYFLCEKLK